MPLEEFKRWLHKKSFVEKLDWFNNSVKQYMYCDNKSWEHGIGVVNENYYRREAKGQLERAKWLYSELIEMYNHERQMRIYYQKLAKR